MTGLTDTLRLTTVPDSKATRELTTTPKALHHMKYV